MHTHGVQKEKIMRRVRCWWNLQDLKSFDKMIGKQIGFYSILGPLWRYSHRCCLIQNLQIQLPSCKSQSNKWFFQNPDYYFNFSAMYLHFCRIQLVEFGPNIVMSMCHITLSYFFFCKFSLIFYINTHTFICVCLCKWFHFSVIFEHYRIRLNAWSVSV